MDSCKWTKWHVLLINDRYSKRGKLPCIHSPANKTHLYVQYLISANLVSKKRVLFKLIFLRLKRGSRWLSGKESACQCRRHRVHRFNPWVRKIPWRKKWQPTPVFLPGESHGLRSLWGYSPWGHKESNMTERLNTHAQGKNKVIMLGPNPIWLVSL